MQVYLNGSFVPHDRASVNVFDRGFIFGDGLYEGIRAYGGHIRSLDRHIRRLKNGLAEIRLQWDAQQLATILPELLIRNGMQDAFIYVQVTRGVPAPGRGVRTRVPDGPITPTVMAYCTPAPTLTECLNPPAKTAMTLEDFRWHKGHIKSISLMGNVMAAMTAADEGWDDAIFVRDGLVGEATSTNLVACVNGQLVTPSLDSVSILGGITRELQLDGDMGVISRPMTVAELRGAEEVMIVGTLTTVAGVVKIDGRPVGAGVIGPRTKKLAADLVAHIRAEYAATGCCV